MESLSAILTRHFIRNPAMQVQDLYKLLHQAALGSEHAVSDEKAACEWLESELSCLGEGPDDPLMDPISPDGQLLRIHLRPYITAGKDPEKILRAFVQTANQWRGSQVKLKEYGKRAVQLAKSGSIPLSGEVIQDWFGDMQIQGYPAVHHSKIYQQLYHPAYRVVARQFLEEK
jgi:hypothetical protein